jgi:hypothetical protein
LSLVPSSSQQNMRKNAFINALSFSLMALVSSPLLALAEEAAVVEKR